MYKIARLLIVSFFFLSNLSFADTGKNLEIHLGDDSEAFKDISVNKSALTSDERKTLKAHHKEIKGFHNRNVGSGGYKIIHMDKRPSGTLESAIKFKHPEGGEFVYQSVVKPGSDSSEGGHKLARVTKVYGAYRETIALNQAKSKKAFFGEFKKEFNNVKEIINSSKMIGDNFKGLDDKDFQKQFKRISKMISSDSVKLEKYATDIQEDKYLSYLHQTVDNVNQTMENGISDRDTTNRLYESFRSAFDDFYNERFQGWDKEVDSAKQTLKESTRVMAARHPGKFQAAAKQSWGDRISSWFSSRDSSEEGEDEEDEDK